ncbi:YlmH/Sll1252 family protein [Saccharibacillus sp. CPCC 101409]|uniref:YlmH family RNA-binding protein n=1 Tax=Saccharibacillus sp. CPCC 101409 TaxID=3058041 RepID=UPI0026735215|nr:YlmH/Sll1252 family protein [Saccharibacillus sp. CPCC 101409]MDO3409220.1 YlmH/Sll1252 family protein [Saccharibacillus sp. CPCC 101409]
MSKKLYEHVHPDEREFVDRAAEWLEGAARYHEVKLTDFLDPRQAQILEMLAGSEPDVRIRLSGGGTHAERCRALIAPDYRELDGEDMKLAVLSITPADTKFTDIGHGDYMGSVLGLGMKRAKIGDIHPREDGCHIVVAAEIADFLNLELRQVHRVNVFTEVLPLERLQSSESELMEMELTVASPRLDAIVSDVYRMSRAKILAPIKAGRCRVNWKVEEDPSNALRTGDTVSLQGFGRFRVLEIGDLTKKGRYRVRIGKFV